MKNIINILKKYHEISDYKIVEVQTNSYETFFVHKSLETVRATSTTDKTVTVYVDHDGKRGDSVFSVYASTTDEELQNKLALAIEKAKLVNNQSYVLPQNQTLDEKIYSNMSEYQPKDLALQIANACFDACTEQNGSINALEIFLYRKTIHIVNGSGVDKREQKYQAMIEAIPTWTQDGHSVELYECYNFSTFDYDDIKREIGEKMQQVKHRYFATKPQTNPTCPVILNGAEIGNLLENIINQLNYGTVYTRSNAFSKGDDIQVGDNCDKITLTLKGKIAGGKNNALFDGDGVTLEDTTVIENGKVIANYGGNRFAQYLGEKVTGNLPCCELTAGSLPLEQMLSNPYFECVSMSGLQVDIYNDYIGGEVRLAYYFDGEKRIPLTGISISGKLSEALANVRFSKEIATSDDYRGPQKAMFGKIAVI